MSECKACEAPRECSICACSESDGKKMLFLSDIYAKHPTLPTLCGCASDTGKTFCSVCFLNTLVGSVAPLASGSSTLGAQTVIITYKCPFCRDEAHAGITRQMWFKLEAIASDNLLLVIAREALNVTPEKGKKFHLKPGPGSDIFLTPNEDERIVPLFTLDAQCTQGSVVFNLHSRLRFQRSCCMLHCEWFDIAEYRGSSRRAKKVVVRVRAPPRRSKRLNTVTDERPMKISKTN